MQVEGLTRSYPSRFRVCAGGAWDSIRTHGLWPAAEIARTSGLSGEEQAHLLDRPRPASVTVRRPVLGPAVIRNQVALRERISRRRLSTCPSENS